MTKVLTHAPVIAHCTPVSILHKGMQAVVTLLDTMWHPSWQSTGSSHREESRPPKNDLMEHSASPQDMAADTKCCYGDI